MHRRSNRASRARGAEKLRNPIITESISTKTSTAYISRIPSSRDRASSERRIEDIAHDFLPRTLRASSAAGDGRGDVRADAKMFLCAKRHALSYAVYPRRYRNIFAPRVSSATVSVVKGTFVKDVPANRPWLLDVIQRLEKFSAQAKRKESKCRSHCSRWIITRQKKNYSREHSFCELGTVWDRALMCITCVNKCTPRTEVPGWKRSRPAARQIRRIEL